LMMEGGQDKVEEKLYEHIEIDPSDVQSLILTYLIHHCYADTAQAFIEACNIDAQEGKRLMNGIHERSQILSLVRQGQVEKALALTDKLFPELLAKRPNVRFKLLCQQFIELIRHRKKEEALDFAQKEWSPYAVEESAFSEELQDVFALIAYEDPESSPVASYMQEAYKEQVVSTLNSAMLEHLNLPSEAPMEVILRHLTLVRQYLAVVTSTRSTSASTSAGTSTTKQKAWNLHDYLSEK